MALGQVTNRARFPPFGLFSWAARHFRTSWRIKRAFVRRRTVSSGALLACAPWPSSTTHPFPPLLSPLCPQTTTCCAALALLSALPPQDKGAHRHSLHARMMSLIRQNRSPIAWGQSPPEANQEPRACHWSFAPLQTSSGSRGLAATHWNSLGLRAAEADEQEETFHPVVASLAGTNAASGHRQGQVVPRSSGHKGSTQSGRKRLRWSHECASFRSSFKRLGQSVCLDRDLCSQRLS